MKKRRALSPVIATVLLIAIALVLAVIIFLWARSFIGEGLEKDGRAIDKACENVVFNADASVSEVSIENLGNVAIYGIEIKTVDSAVGTISQAEDFDNTVTIGNTESVGVETLGLSSGENLIIIPILLGERRSQTGTHKCDEDYGVEVIVA